MNRGRPGFTTRDLLFTATCLLSTSPACTAAPSPPSTRDAAPRAQLTRIATGLQSPVHLTSPPGDPRQFVVEQPGRIRIVENGRLVATPFLDLTSRVSFGGERGLLSMAFHPRYATNGLFYVNYTDKDGDTRVERYHVSADAARADPGSAKRVLTVEQPYANHNGGHLLFGPDGKLYVGLGDGGSGYDPRGHGQNPKIQLAKMLRLDVAADSVEILDLELRNP